MFIDFGSTRSNLGPQLLTERLVQLDKDFQNAYLGGYMAPTMFNHRMGIKWWFIGYITICKYYWWYITMIYIYIVFMEINIFKWESLNNQKYGVFFESDKRILLIRSVGGIPERWWSWNHFVNGAQLQGLGCPKSEVTWCTRLVSVGLYDTVNGCEILPLDGWNMLKPYKNNRMFTIVFNWYRISLAHPQYLWWVYLLARPDRKDCQTNSIGAFRKMGGPPNHLFE